MEIHLYRSSTSRILFGVCGGIGALLHVDPTIIRLIWLATLLLGGSGILFYIIAALLLPVGP